MGGISSVVTNFPRSGLSTEANGDSNTGNLSIETGKLIVRDGAFVSTVTFGDGSGGDLTVKASESVELVGVDGQFATGLFAETSGSGDAGNLTIDTGKFVARNGGYASTSSFGEGQAGDLNVDVVESVEFIGTKLNANGDRFSSGFFSFTNSEKDAGDITISTKRLLIEDGGQAFSGSAGGGRGGNLTVNASEFVKVVGIEPIDGFFGSRLATRTDGDGDAGNLSINTRKLIIQDGGQISGSTFSNGNAGNVIVNASESVEIIDSNEPIGPNDLVSGIYAQTGNTESKGNGGNIEINTPVLSLTDGGAVIANTSNKGNAGNINLNVEDNLILSGNDTGLFSRTSEEAIGNSGSISLDTKNLTITDGATVAVNSQGQGNGGVVSITTSDLTLDNKASISASTVAGEGGEIFLTIDDNLVLRNNSTITAQAFQDADGGNIVIDTGFIVAFPNQNNDIIANAAQGRGGNIKIRADSVFGIEERSLNPISNDINASSARGAEFDGVIEITTPDVDPFQETRETPESIVATDAVVAGTCDPVQVGSDILAGTENTFVIKGKGGISPQPIEPISADIILFEGKPVETESEKRTRQEIYPPIMTSQGAIYPARGMVKNSDGTVFLTVYPTNNTRRVLNNSPNCNPIK